MKAFIGSKLRYVFFVVLAAFFMSPAMAAVTNYVTFNDGRMLVFPDTCIASSSNADGVLTFVALDGTVFSYNLEDIASIDRRLTKQLPTITSFEFDNKYNYQVFTDAAGVITTKTINVEVAGIGKWLTASFDLSHEDARVTVDGIEQVSKQSRLHFAPSRVYTVGFPTDFVLALQPEGGYAFAPFGRQYIVTVDYLTDHSTSVPRIDINTVDGVDITSKKVYVDAEIIIDGAGVFPSMTDSVQIKGRGNSSWSSNPSAKNPYRLKFAEKVKPLGLTKGKNWVLLANKLHGSMMTNAIGMKVASLIGTEAANHIIPVDLYINGTYKGSYNFTEKVGFGNNSVDLDDESAAALLELDVYYDEPTGQKFKSSPYKIPVNIKEPEFADGTTLLTLNNIKQRFNSFASAVQNNEDISQYADIDHMSRYFLMNDYICNLELYWPKSTFCYYENVLDEDSKLKFGPVWDLDWGYGYDGSYSYSYFSNNADYDYFHRVSGMTMTEFMRHIGDNPQVTSKMYLIWKDFMVNGLDELCDFCQEYYDYALPSFMNNKAEGLDNSDYAAQVTKAVNWLRQRADYIFEDLKLKYEIPGDVNVDGEVNIADINTLIDILLGGKAEMEKRRRADVNGDGEITIGDVNPLITIVMGI